MKTNSLFKRLVSMLIVVLMICTVFPVTALAYQGQPSAPGFEDLFPLLKVEIDCDTESEEDEDEDKHPKITYDLLNNTEGSYDSFSVTQSDIFGYQYTVTVYSERYIQAYSETYGPHIPEDDDDISETVILEYKLVNTGSSWKLKWCLADGEDDDIDFDVVCLNAPTDSELSSLLGNNAVTIDCVNTGVSHNSETYPLSSGYTVSEPVLSNGQYICTVTIDSANYITAYNTSTEATHSLVENEPASKTITLAYDGEKWAVSGDASVTFNVECVTPDPVWSGLSISKTSNAENGKVVPGATIIYTIKVKNETGRDLSDITVSENLDANLTLVSATPTIGEYNLTKNEWTISSLNKGAEATLTINATVATGSLHGTKIGNEAVIVTAKAGGESLPSNVKLNGRCDVDVYNPAVTGIEKEVVKDPTGLTNVPTGITYPNANNIATVPYGTTSVTLLYRVTVRGDAGASYSVTDTDATCISNNASGTIPEGGNAVLYFTKTFTGLTTGDNTCSNTAAVGNTNSNTVDVTVKVSIPEKPTEKYLEEELLANGAVKIDCTNTKVNHADKTYGLLKGSYDIGEPQKVERTDVYTCEITVYAAPYVAQYSTDMNKGHSLADVGSKKVILVYNGDEWIVPPVELAAGDDFEYESAFPVTFNVVCEETPATTYTVTYKDGVGGKVFKDDVHTVESGATTPAFVGGIPTRPGYVFVGWTPAVSRCVTGNATYTATWRKVKDTTVIEIGGGNSSSSSKEENPNTGAPVFVGVSVGALAAAK